MFSLGLAADTCPTWLRWFYHQDLIILLLRSRNYGMHSVTDVPVSLSPIGPESQDVDTAPTVDRIAMPTATPYTYVAQPSQ
ncbi:hypothetical protein BDW22DRAFT_1361131 [Trametopsis cervina]|nr:hypothetical protein BDW22DRAFT_1361131 [Trametopsis cervina]